MTKEQEGDKTMDRNEYSSGQLNNSAGLLKETRKLSPVRDNSSNGIKLLGIALMLFSVAGLLAFVLWRMWR